MENKEINNQAQQQLPNPDLKSLEKLIGTWKVSGGMQGTNSFEWAESGFFLVQKFDFDHGGRKIKGMEIIGHEQGFSAEPSAEIKTRAYSFLDGMTLDYVYEMDDDGTLTIWGGEKGSPAYCTTRFSDDGNTATSEWVYPGGGYQVTGKRIK